MVYFQTKNSNLGIFWKAFYSHLVYFLVIWKFCGSLVSFLIVLVCCTKKKSVNPGPLALVVLGFRHGDRLQDLAVGVEGEQCARKF
jgi:ABC-type Fe3+-siderophore transport system permease subunit